MITIPDVMQAIHQLSSQVELSTPLVDDRGLDAEIISLRNQLRSKEPPSHDRDWWNSERLRLMDR